MTAGTDPARLAPDALHAPPRAGAARRRGVAGWFDPRGRRLGGIAFALNRLGGLGVLAYLYLHLVILSQLAAGAGAWDRFVEVALSPLVLVMDVVLLAGLLVHGLNGIRVTLLGLGLVATHQRALYVALMVVAAIVLAVGALRMAGGA